MWVLGGALIPSIRIALTPETLKNLSPIPALILPIPSVLVDLNPETLKTLSQSAALILSIRISPSPKTVKKKTAQH